nr:hypothetical protein Iba_scaffold22740CG0020 [Ipomoea batatas]
MEPAKVVAELAGRRASSSASSGPFACMPHCADVADMASSTGGLLDSERDTRRSIMAAEGVNASSSFPVFNDSRKTLLKSSSPPLSPIPRPSDEEGSFDGVEGLANGAVTFNA